MSLQGPVVVVSAEPHREIVSALASAGGFPVVEAGWSEAAAAISKIGPAAVVLADPPPALEPRLVKALTIDRKPLMPVVARIPTGITALGPQVLPMACDAPGSRMVARLGSALRIRTLHATVLRRVKTLASASGDSKTTAIPDGDPLDDATVLVLGRGRTYPALCVAVGERVGLIGALGVETAARYLNARDVDGILIGDGFSPRVVEAFLTVIGEDARFRDLPVAALAGLALNTDPERLPNFEAIEGEPGEVVERLLPLVRLHAFEARLRRVLGAVEAEGALDPRTGLFTPAAFRRDLAQAIDQTHVTGASLSIARFSFPAGMARRAHLDAARLAGRLLRGSDFACCEDDGAILLAFAETDLRSAHVVARRIASVLKHTMLAPDRRESRLNPTITLAALRSSDTPDTLLARVTESDSVAAEYARP
jgi:hypothetical protein